MKILVYRWKAYNYADLLDGLCSLDHSVDTFYYDIADFDQDPEFCTLLKEILEQEHYDLLMSINYFTVISNVCHEREVPYVSWNCDSMLISMYNYSVFHPENYIFTFDFQDVVKFRAMGVKHIYYLPLAAAPKRVHNVLSERRERVTAEISFVGRLYERSRYDVVEPQLSDYLRGYLEAALWAQLQVCGGNLLQEMLTDPIMLALEDYFQLKKAPDSFADLSLIFCSTVLGFKAAQMERELCLHMLSLSHEVHLYTTSDTDSLPQVKNCGRADYWNEMPKIFRDSKINLNFTIPNIIDGTPLRVLDILACGGFCLTSGRPDLGRHFQDGHDLVVFEGREDLLKKADYYLSHEDERLCIAQNGQRLIQQKHTYEIRLQEMFAVLETV